MSTAGQIAMAVCAILAVVGFFAALAWEAWRALRFVWRNYIERERKSAYDAGWLDGLEEGSRTEEKLALMRRRQKRAAPARYLP